MKARGSKGMIPTHALMRIASMGMLFSGDYGEPQRLTVKRAAPDPFSGFCHPTKGWRNTGTRDRGKNRRRLSPVKQVLRDGWL